MDKLKDLTRKIFSTKIIIPLLILFYIANFFANGEPYVRSDGFCYFHTAKSIVTEANFVTSQKPEYWNYMGHVQNTYGDKYISVCSPGTSLFLLPGLFISNLFRGNSSISNDYYIAYNGHTLADGISILITAMVVSLISLYLIYKSLRLLRFTEQLAWFSTTVVFLCSYALWYVFILPAFTHTYELFTVSLLLYVYLKAHISKKSIFYLLIGVASGLMILVRPVLLPILILIVLSLLWGRKDVKTKLKQLLLIAFGGLPFLLILLDYNYISYGNVLSTGYAAIRGENFDLTQFHYFELLFSPLKGWFVFSPIYLLSVFGLWKLPKKDTHLKWISLVSIFSIAFIYSFWSQWWGGGSYGSRFMIFAIPFGAIGLARFIEWLKTINKKRLTSILIVILTLFSTSILILYRFVNVNGSWFYTPFFFYKTEIDYAQQSTSIGDFLNRNYNSIYEGSGILKILSKQNDYVILIRENQAHKEINLKTVTPPEGTTLTLPEQLDFYVLNKLTNKAYTYIDDSSKEATIDLNKLNELQEVKGESLKLPTSDYLKLIYFEGSIELYVKKTDHISVAGNLAYIPREQTYFIIK